MVDCACRQVLPAHGKHLLRRAAAARAARALHVAFGAACAPDDRGAGAPRRQAGGAAHRRRLRRFAHAEGAVGIDKEKAKQALDKVFRDMAGAMSAGMVYVGVKTGLFKTMSARGALTVQQVVQLSKLQPRYVEEWLKGMVAAGYLDYDPAAQTYTL